MKNAIWLPGYQVTLEFAEDGVQHFLVSCATTADVCPKCGVIERLYRHGIGVHAARDQTTPTTSGTKNRAQASFDFQCI